MDLGQQRREKPNCILYYGFPSLNGEEKGEWFKDLYQTLDNLSWCQAPVCGCQATGCKGWIWQANILVDCQIGP